MAKTKGTYIRVACKNVFGYISTNSWPFFMIQRPTIVRSNTWRDKRPVFFGFSMFRQTSQLATEKIQNLCNRNQWSGLLQLGSVWFRSFFQSSKLDLQTLPSPMAATCICHLHPQPPWHTQMTPAWQNNAMSIVSSHSSQMSPCQLNAQWWCGTSTYGHAAMFDDNDPWCQH